MKDRAGCIFVIIYILMGFVQLFAVIKGIQIWFGVGAFFAFILSMFITYIPFVGTIAGIVGAVKGWGWSYAWAILLFGWYYLIILILLLTYLIYLISVGVNELFKRK